MPFPRHLRGREVPGSEGISQCYAFEVTLVSDNLEIDLEGVMENPAKLVLHRDEGTT